MSTRITLYGASISAQRSSQEHRTVGLINVTNLRIRCEDGHEVEICVHSPKGAVEPLEVELLPDRVER